MKHLFTIILCLLCYMASNAQIFKYSDTWVSASELTIINQRRVTDNFVQFRADDVTATSGYIIFPATDLSTYGDQLDVTIVISINKTGVYNEGNYELQITDNYTGDVTSTQWTTLDNDLLAGAPEWNSDWTMNHTASVSVTNTKGNAVVLALKAVGNNAESDVLSRVKSVTLSDPLATSLPSDMSFQITIGPNPVGDVLKVEGTSEGAKYSVCSISGKIIKAAQSNGNEIYLTGLSQGVYLLVIEEGSKRIIHKFIKK